MGAVCLDKSLDDSCNAFRKNQRFETFTVSVRRSNLIDIKEMPFSVSQNESMNAVW